MLDDVIVFALLVFYKIVILLVGLSFAYMGYRLFMVDKTSSSGDFKVQAGKYALSLLGGAPGIFFSLFGTILICISVFKGVEFKRDPIQQLQTPTLDIVIPEHPPFNDKQAK